MNKKINIFLLIFCLTNVFANGQELAWSLQKCIAIAMENNLEIQIQQLEIKRTQKSNPSLLNEMMPSINFTASQSYNFGSTIDPATNGRVSSNIQYDNFYLNAQMNLFDFNTLATIQKNKLNLAITKAEKEVIENEYKLQVLESFYQALFMQELFKIQQQQLQNSKENLNRIEKEVAIGNKPKSDLYDIRFLFSQDEKRLLETEQAYVIQKIQLFQLINFSVIDTVEMITLEIPLASLSTNNTDENINPKIKVAELNYEKSLKEIHFQRAANLPVLSAYYQISSFYYKPLNQPSSMVDSFNNQIGNNKNQQIGLQLNIPVFNGFKNSKKVHAAKIETEKSKLKIETENQKRDKQLELERYNQRNYISLQEKLNNVLLHATNSFQTTQAKYTSGKIDTNSFALSKNNLLTSEYELLKNELMIQFSVFKIHLIQVNAL
ncbi:TolC family protein [Flavobacterium sp. J27]|uniref:TolC family protein n=1 Tax=Flavobacterium sp. J27 TaxID=2060419 RepID=UPI001031EB8F|nr:TolC family protein [Flavobacterium sp. J27]